MNTVTDEKIDELKPCPFCGGAASIDVQPDETGDTIGYYVSCDGCEAAINDLHDTKEIAVSRWNTRTTLPAFDVEAVVKEIEELDEIGWGTEFCDCGISYPTYSPRKRGFGTHIRKADVLSILRRHSEVKP